MPESTQKKEVKKKSSKSGKVVRGERYEIRFSGSGGHGVILAAVMMSEAAGRNPKLNVIQTQSYGPEARGGSSKADVVISKEKIYYPKAMKLDMLLAFTQEACDKYYTDLKPNGLLVVDSNMVTKLPIKNSYGFSFIRIAREQVGHPMVANVIALGAMAALTGLVSKDDLKEVIKIRAPRGTEEKNLKAVKIGYDLGLKALKEKEG